jgi:DNA-binding NarL/FixJ family response regulator
VVYQLELKNSMIRLGIAEDQALFRIGIVGFLNSFSRIKVVEETENSQELLDKYNEIGVFNEDISYSKILDLNTPFVDGIKTIELVTQ